MCWQCTGFTEGQVVEIVDILDESSVKFHHLEVGCFGRIFKYDYVYRNANKEEYPVMGSDHLCVVFAHKFENKVCAITNIEFIKSRVRIRTLAEYESRMIKGFSM